MDQLIYIVYILILVLLFFKCQFEKKSEYNADYMSLSQVKSIQGYAAVLIMLHHISQKLCDPSSVPEKYIKHGLEPFLFIGYLLVAIYFFCSGYGLYQSYRKKEDYFKGYFFNRYIPLLFVLVITSFAFVSAVAGAGMPFYIYGPMTVFGPSTVNPYAWYVYAIIICYFLFYIGFKKCKKESAAIAVVIIGIILYMLFCNYWMYGDWWYNTVLVFPAGIIYARNEAFLIEKIKMNYKKFLIIALVVLAACFIVSEYMADYLRNQSFLLGYCVGQMIVVIFRTVAALSFVLLVLLFSMKVQVKNKLLVFLGSHTLEFYLIHGYFVQIFAREFLNASEVSIHYIENPLLYIIAVFCLTCAMAFILQLLLNLFIKWAKKSLYSRLMFKTIIHMVIVFLIIAILISVKTKYEDIRDTNARKDLFASYSEQQSYVETSYGRMAYFTEGEGEHTIVLLGKNLDPSSQLVLRYVSQFLADDNKVIIFDTLGRGFSDDTDRERSTDNITEEIHEALDALALDDKYILMACEYSGNYAMRYIEKYPDEIEGLIGVDMMVPKLYDAMIRASGVPESIYKEAMQKEYSKDKMGRNIANALGYSRWLYASYENYWMGYNLADHQEMIEEVFCKNLKRDTALDEEYLWGDNCSKITMTKLPEDMPVLLLIDYVYSEFFKVGTTDYRTLTYSYISNNDMQRLRTVEGDSNFVYYKGPAIAEMVKAYVKDNFE